MMPKTQRKFSGKWDEIVYLRRKLIHWFYVRQSHTQAASYANRLGKLLPNVPDRAIITQECWSLVYETNNEIEKAIEHRKDEITLILRLHKISRDGIRYLADRYDSLASLYLKRNKQGDIKEAIQLLKKSKTLAKKHGHEFEVQELLEELRKLNKQQ